MKTSVRVCRPAKWLAMITCITAVSASASSVPRDQESFRCNAPYGQGDGKATMIPDAFSNVSGKISFHSADKGAEWDSLAQILVHQHGADNIDGDCGRDGIAVYAAKDHIEFYMTSNGHEVPMAQSPYDTPIAFKISISPQGVMTVAIGATNPEIKTITLRHPEHNSVEMTCSGADVSFLNIAAL